MPPSSRRSSQFNKWTLIGMVKKLLWPEHISRACIQRWQEIQGRNNQNGDFFLKIMCRKFSKIRTSLRNVPDGLSKILIWHASRYFTTYHKDSSPSWFFQRTWILWSFVKGAPNASLLAAYSTARSRAAWPMPTPCPAIPILPPSNVDIAILNPWPGSPRTFPFGILQSSKIKFVVDDPLMPSLSSFLPTLNPGVGFGTTNALIPLCFLDLSVVAKTYKWSEHVGLC